MNFQDKKTIVSLVIAAVALAAVAALSTWLEGVRPKLPDHYQDSDLALNAKRLKGYALGAEGLIADWYWIMSLQYLGNKLVEHGDKDIDLNDLSALNARLLYPYLDAATELDPKFYAAYSYGAAVLPAIDANKAIELTEKGIRNNPESWRLHQYLGYIYWRKKDYEKAANTYETGSRLSGAPLFMRQMAAVMRSEGGSVETARAMYRQILAEAEDEQSKRSAQLRLFELDADDEITAINMVLAEVKKSGKCPSRISEIFPKLAAVQLPDGRDFRINEAGELVDPTDVPYVFDAAACTVKLAVVSAIPKKIE